MVREILELTKNWKFSRDDHPGCEGAGYTDNGWATVRIPHDWAISGPFDKEHDLHRIESPQADVGTGVTEISGRTGGLPHVGVGWYRKKIRIPMEAAGKQFRLEIDGAMSRSQVYCNGKAVGGWPYGYSSFALDLTEALLPGEENLIAIRLENLEQSSRWYPGAGLYRHIRLVMLNPIHVDHWGTYVTTPEISEDVATVQLKTRLKNSGEATQVSLRTTIRNAEGAVETQEVEEGMAAASWVVEQKLQVACPKRWMPGQPNLYQITTEVLKDGEVIDLYQTPLGFRTLTFDPEKGFFINGVPMKMNGVCLHHDLGPLGAAVNRAALRRQLKLLQEMGCNAIRTSHNPPTPELLALCDSMGFLLIDEAFDEWKIGKLDHGYHVLFEEWAEKDLRAMIRRDRNHPCVIMWSIGNEIMEQWEMDGGNVAAFLHDICHDEDPSRPTTAGFNEPHKAVANGLADAVDVPGWNYYPHDYVKLHHRMAGKATYGSETESTLSSRGEYHFPVNEEVMPIRENLQVNSFDMCYPPWAYSPDVEFRAQDDCDFMLGEFVWTGFDYLGEPTPYVEQWPSRSSYFGILDLCGIPKDRYYLYQSKWTDKDVLHLLPHWTWLGREGSAPRCTVTPALTPLSFF